VVHRLHSAEFSTTSSKATAKAKLVVTRSATLTAIQTPPQLASYTSARCRRSEMATMTRSSRRADGFHRSDRHDRVLRHGRAPDTFVAANTRAHAPKQTMSGLSPSSKRKADAIDDKLVKINPKRTRITVDILSGPLSRRNTKEGPKPSRQRSPVVAERSPTVPKAAAVTATARQANARAARPTANTSAPLTKHREKVINGIKHELDRLEPSDDDFRPQGRKLRSQEATRFKSELSAYFPEYDEVIGNEPKQERAFLHLAICLLLLLLSHD
jgi:hypothetical protein